MPTPNPRFKNLRFRPTLCCSCFVFIFYLLISYIHVCITRIHISFMPINDWHLIKYAFLIPFGSPYYARTFGPRQNCPSISVLYNNIDPINISGTQISCKFDIHTKHQHLTCIVILILTGMVFPYHYHNWLLIPYIHMYTNSTLVSRTRRIVFLSGHLQDLRGSDATLTPFNFFLAYLALGP